MYKNPLLIKRLTVINNLKSYSFIIMGVMLAAMGLKGFLFPNHLLDGGAMGLALLVQMLTSVNLSVLIILINLPFIVLGAKQISIQFAIKSVIAIILLAAVVYFIKLPAITEDNLLISVFGGFFLGAGIGFTIRGGAVIDGTEVLAITVSRKSPLTVGDFIAIFNCILFACSALLVDIETAMFSMLTYLSASKTVDFIINGIEEYIGVLIISRNSESIKHQIIHELGRGVTVFRAEKGHGKKGTEGNDGHVLFTVVTRLEVTKLLQEIEKIDDDCFVVQYPIKDTKGGMIKKRPLHH